MHSPVRMLIRLPSGRSGNPSLVPGTHRGSCRIGSMSSSPDAEGPDSKADHSSTSVAEIKNAYSYTSTPPYVATV